MGCVDLQSIRHFRQVTAEEEIMAARIEQLERALGVALDCLRPDVDPLDPPRDYDVDLIVASGRNLLAE